MKGHIRQRGKRSWAVKLDIGPDPVTGKRRSKWHTVHGTKRDAERECNRLLHVLDEGSYVEPTGLTLAEFLVGKDLDSEPKGWLGTVAASRTSPKTLERYREIVDKHIIPALGKVQLQKLTATAIEAFYGTAQASGRRDGKGACPPAPCFIFTAC